MKKTLILFIISILIIAASPYLGREIVFPNESLQASSIFWNLRLPRVLTAFVVGSLLSLCGLLFQALFRNSLASPYTLGVASGASFGASLYFLCGLNFSNIYFSGVSIFSLAGALLSIFLVYLLGRVKGKMDMHALLLGGVIIGMFFSSLILLVQMLLENRDSLQVLRWIMGGVNVVGFSSFIHLLPFLILGTLFSFLKRGELNLMYLGDALAISKGLNLERSRVAFFFMTSLMIAGVVSECGPIGFVGLIVPHLVKKYMGTDHTFLIPAAILAGGNVLVICDLLSRCLFLTLEIPIGIITSLVGAPFFLFLLMRERG